MEAAWKAYRRRSLVHSTAGTAKTATGAAIGVPKKVAIGAEAMVGAGVTTGAGVGAAAAAVAEVLVIPGIILMVGGVIMEVRSATKTRSHLLRLERLKSAECTCTLDCGKTLDYVKEQKRKKQFRRGLKATLVGAVYEAPRAKIHAGWKRWKRHDRGVERERMAKRLREAGQGGCGLALQIVAELLGDYTDARCMRLATTLVKEEDNWEVLFPKLAST